MIHMFMLCNYYIQDLKGNRNCLFSVSTDKVAFKNNIVDRTKLLSMSDLGLKFH